MPLSWPRWIALAGLALAASLSTTQVWPHGGGVDYRGCHNDSSKGEYHCHRGPLDSRIFQSEAEAIRALEGGASGFDQTSQASDRAYDRDLYGGWGDADSDCQDMRDEVLVAQGSEIKLSGDGCEVIGGVWRGSYPGNTFTDPRELHIDHVVPLKEAHVSGARAWPASKRHRFANNPGNLLAVEAGANMSKGSRGPSDWLPETGQCVYVRQWVAVKRKWDLEMDRLERESVERLLAECP